MGYVSRDTSPFTPPPLPPLVQLAALEGGDRAFCFTSGMAAIAAVCKLVSNGEHILAGEDIYGGTSRLLSQVGEEREGMRVMWG